MSYTPSTDTSTLVVALGYAFQSSFTGPTTTINSVGFAFVASDVGKVIMIQAGDPNVKPGFVTTWTTVATFVSSSQITVSATIAGSSIAVVNAVLYRPLAMGQAAINSVETGSLEIDLSLTSFATAQFTIVSLDGSLIPVPFTPVLITDTEVGVEYFGGEIQSNEAHNVPGSTVVLSMCRCQGWEVIAKRWTSGGADAQINQDTTYGTNNPALGTFVNLRADQIMDWYQRNFIQNDGTSGSYDTTGPTIPVFQSIAAKFSDTFDQLCNNATTPGKQFNWYFGPRKQLTLKTLNTTAAPFNLKDSDSSSGNALASLQNTLSNENYFNRALATVDRITQQFVGTGAARTFTLNTAVPPGALGQVSILLNGQNQTIGVLNSDKGKQWYYSPNSPTITQDASGTTLATTDVLAVSFPIWIEIFNDALPEQAAMATIQAGSGTWEQKIDLQAVSTAVDAATFVQSMLDEAKKISQELKISTYRPGLNIGQTIQIQLAAVGVSSITAFLIDTLTITTDNNRKLFTFTASLDAPYLGNWTRKMKRGLGTASGVHGSPLAIPGTANSAIVAAGGAIPGGGGGGGFRIACEVPTGIIDGTNTVFTVSHPIATSPAPILSVNGVIQDPLNATVDYTFQGATITYTVPPESGAKHVIWYWWGDGSGRLARNFNGGTDVIDYGNNPSVFDLIGDMAAGMWIMLTSSTLSGDQLMTSGKFTVGSLVTTLYFNLSTSGSSGSWGVNYLHDSASGVTYPVTLALALPNNKWVYVGISRDVTAKTITGYYGDGNSMQQFGPVSYSTNPNSGITTGHMVVGQNYTLGSNTLHGDVQEHYVWNRKLSQSEHYQAMKGAPPSSGLILNCQMGNTPEVDLSPTGASGAVTGTTLITGHS